ncbi:MAG: hypothetical protein R6U04_08080 [Bacteroidales bacterium]
MRSRLLIVFLIILILPVTAYAQREDEEEGGYEDLLFKEVEVENPVYYPVLSVGTGMFNYFGEFDNVLSGMGSMPPLKFNVYHFLDQQNIFRINVFVMTGNLNGNLNEIEDPERYSNITNFQTELFAVGLNLEYGFGHFYEQTPKFRPFFALGGEVLVFDPKSDFGYNWEDQVVHRDYDFEHNLRSANDFNLSSFGQNTAAVTFDAGFDFVFGERVEVRVGNSFHYTFTDLIDGIPYKDGDGNIVGDSRNDMLNYTYVTFGWDPFSESETETEEQLFADVSDDFDYTAIADEDRDGVLDLHDDCLETPSGVEVDDNGCPFDEDGDGVPDYRDEEPDTPEGSIVDENGIALNDEEVTEYINYDRVAVNREDAYMIPVSEGWRTSKYSTEDGELEIPDKFKPVDKDNNGEISYDELLDAIDDFFNDESDFTANDIYELNDFFFAQ